MNRERKIKICALTTVQKTMDWFVVDSMRNLSKNGYEVTLVCNMSQEFAQQNSDFAKCVNLEMSRGISLKNSITSIAALIKLFKKEKFDIIYYVTPNVSLYASIAGILTGIKLRVYSQCGLRYVSFTGIKRFIFKSLEKITCMLSTCIRAQSPMNMEFAVNEGLCKRKKISVVGIGGTIGVDLTLCDAFDKAEKREEIRKQYEIPQDAFVFGYVGRINTDKGIYELISAFETIKTENTYLMLIGMMDSMDEKTEELVEKSKDNPKIIFTGDILKDKVYEYMSAFDVMVHPTYREGFGKVLQEAMGMSVPIITTNVPGPCEVVEMGASGVLVEACNTEDLAEKMLYVYNDPELRQNLSEIGRKRAETYFDRPIMLKNILGDMNKIVGREEVEKDETYAFNR